MALNRGNPVILVVDDSPDSLGMLNTALNQAGYTVLVALNGAQALDIVQRIQPDVVLMDAIMPVMDGFECSRRMRRLLPLTPIIFMTGLSDEEHTVKAFEHGGDDYLTKPVKSAELLARINAHVNRSNMISQARAALDVARQYVVAVDNGGRVRWATPETRKLFADHGIDLESGADKLAASVQPWLTDPSRNADLILRTNTSPLTLRYFKPVDENEHLLRVVKRDVLLDAGLLETALPITRREAEVLIWVAHGKTNKEIGEILDLSPRTVNKHLEQIYPKIHVDNRSAATSIEIQALLGLPV